MGYDLIVWSEPPGDDEEAALIAERLRGDTEAVDRPPALAAFVAELERRFERDGRDGFPVELEAGERFASIALRAAASTSGRLPQAYLLRSAATGVRYPA